MPAALKLLGEMSSRSGLAPDLYSYAAVMSGLVKARNPKRALQLLGEMREAGVEPDVVCLASAMEACESKGAPQEAAEVLEQVRWVVGMPYEFSVCGCFWLFLMRVVHRGLCDKVDCIRPSRPVAVLLFLPSDDGDRFTARLFVPCEPRALERVDNVHRP